MNSSHDDRPLRRPGCPIRKSPDQSLLSGSPKLIAACHALHRLLAPRHPPCALSSLTAIERATTLEHSVHRKIAQYAVVKEPGATRCAGHTGRCSAVVSLRLERRMRSPRAPLLRESRPPNSAPEGCLRSRALTGPRDGAEGDRTLDLRLAKPALSQLSYSPSRRR